MSIPTIGSLPSAAGQPTSDQNSRLRAVAQDLEAAFLSEMLKHAGLGEARESFGGGVGEEQFMSLMRTQHAQAIAESGGIGLSESIFQSLVARAEAGR